jgi:hypothetical protein
MTITQQPSGPRVTLPSMLAVLTRPRAPRRALATLPLVALAVLVSGCGSSPSPSVANLGATSTSAAAQTTPSASGAPVGSSSQLGGPGGGTGNLRMVGGSRTQMMAFSSCMRSHGVPGFPDPNGQGAISISSSDGIDPNSPAFARAQQACAKLMPGGGPPSPAQQEQMHKQALAYSACMRSHGEPDFPDPTFSANGGVSVRIQASPGSGLDPNSPVFQAAQKSCRSELPGPPGATRAAG